MTTLTSILVQIQVFRSEFCPKMVSRRKNLARFRETDIATILIVYRRI